MASSNTSTANGGSRPAHLEPSKLGTKEYWDSLYTTELTNHAADPADIGTVWFDDSDAEAKIIEFLGKLAGDGSDSDSENDHEDGDGQQGNAKNKGRPLLSRTETSFLDLGCGNGSLLFALRDDSWSGPALGVDYSAQSIALAQQVASSRATAHDSSPSCSPDEPPTTTSTSTPSFLQWDVIAGPYSTILSGPQSSGFDAVLDKGTFDAISLSDEKDHRGRRLCELYRGRVMRLLKKGGIFLVTSCNWTEEELRGWFEGERQDDDEGDEVNGQNGGAGGGRFVVADRVNYRTFSFGGVKGQTISTLCFRRES